MRTVEIVFFWVNWMASSLTAYAFWGEYRKLRKRDFGYASATEAFEFIVHCLMVLWWLIGSSILAILGLNPFWIFGWAFIGLVLSLVVLSLAKASGLLVLAGMGEIQLKEAAEEQAAAFHRMVTEEQD